MSEENNEVENDLLRLLFHGWQIHAVISHSQFQGIFKLVHSRKKHILDLGEFSGHILGTHLLTDCERAVTRCPKHYSWFPTLRQWARPRPKYINLYQWLLEFCQLWQDHVNLKKEKGEGNLDRCTPVAFLEIPSIKFSTYRIIKNTLRELINLQGKLSNRSPLLGHIVISIVTRKKSEDSKYYIEISFFWKTFFQSTKSF